MLAYIAKRLLFSVFTLFLIVTITFFLMHAIPSSPFIGGKALTPTVMKQLEMKFGLDKPLGEQYIIYLKNTARLDFGMSTFHKGRKVIDLITITFKVSAKIGLIAAAIALASGILLGSLAALKKDTIVDRLIIVLTTALVSLPNFLVAIMMLWVFSVMLHWLPPRAGAPGGLVMPIVSLALYPAAYVTRLMRSSVLDVLTQDYIRTASAKGLSTSKVLLKHAVKNAIIPIITYAGPMIAYITTGSFVVEQIFSIGGLGNFFVRAIQNSDYTMIMGSTIYLSIVMLSMTLLCDILYKVVDKRIDFS